MVRFYAIFEIVFAIMFNLYTSLAYKRPKFILVFEIQKVLNFSGFWLMSKREGVTHGKQVSIDLHNTSRAIMRQWSVARYLLITNSQAPCKRS